MRGRWLGIAMGALALTLGGSLAGSWGPSGDHASARISHRIDGPVVPREPLAARIVGVMEPGSPPPGLPIAEPSPEPAVEPTIGQPADDGARVVAVERVEGRAHDLTIESPAVGTVKVRLLLPARFEAEPARRWPVLYLLQGCCDTYDSWHRETDVADLVAETDLLVVMPAATTGGVNGWYSDWDNGGAGGPPAWETFHLVELRQLLERDWRAGEARAVAGLSMGGFGAMVYAARNPGVFRAAASYSGVLDLFGSGLDQVTALWGDRQDDAEVWRAHDPLSLAQALAGIPLYVSYGNGEPGPLDAPEASRDEGEAWIVLQGDAFAARLAELGIPAIVDAYGPGTHTWPYWQRALHASLPMLLEALGADRG